MLLIAVVWCYQFIYESSLRRLTESAPVRVALVVLMILYLLAVPSSGATAFIYFQF